MSLPIVLLVVGAAVFALPWTADPDPRHELVLTERLTGVVVIVALMGAGLKIDRPIGWRRWATTWRLLGIAMPLTIAGIALAGSTLLGFGLGAAVLLGAVLAPTDPVLAADVQVGEPTTESAEEEQVDDLREEDEVRFSLTSEAGLNDGLAFPFVWAAIAIAASAAGEEHRDLLAWVGYDLVYRLAVGVVVGIVMGKLLARVMFDPPGRLTPLADQSEGFVALAATLLAYGVTELLHAYGFVAVFVTAVTLRTAERRHEFHRVLHDFVRQVEELLVVAVLVLFGGALIAGVLGPLTWQGVVVAVLAVFVVRPVAGRLALAGADVRPAERRTIGFFGVRGVGSLYYLAFALHRAPFPEAGELWATVSLALVLSIVVHGVAATPVMERLDRWTARHRDRRERRWSGGLGDGGRRSRPPGRPEPSGSPTPT